MAAITQKPGRIKAVFMGSDELSKTFLTALIHSPGVDVLTVVTQPDKKHGRGLEIKPGPVKELALMHGVPVVAPVKINAPESVAELTALAPDIIVVMAYGQFLGRTILALPRLGCVNLHTSLLPKYRGASPIQHAIMNGDEETGITAMMMARGMDAGDILGASHCAIRPEETAATLGLRLAIRGADLMLDVIRKLDDGICPRIPQDEALATFAPKIDDTTTPAIDWSRTAPEIERHIRAMTPKPFCHTYLPGNDPNKPYMPGLRIKINGALIVNPSGNVATQPGEVISMKDGPLVATGGGGAVLLTQLHIEGKPKPIDGKAFANGYSSKLKIGDTLRSGI